MSGLEVGYLLALERWFRAARTWRAGRARFLARTGSPLRAGRANWRDDLGLQDIEVLVARRDLRSGNAFGESGDVGSCVRRVG